MSELTASRPLGGQRRGDAPHRQRPRGRRWANLVIGILIMVVMLFPVYWMINVSLQPINGAIEANWFPWNAQLSAYIEVIGAQGPNLVTSLLVAIGSVVLSLAIATPAAYALSRSPGRMVDIVLFLILITQMIPGIVVANALYPAFNDLGLLDSIPGLILADASAGIPFAIILMRAFMSNIPTEIIEAAWVDGASSFRAFWSVVIPVSRNALVTAGLFTFLFAWSDFLFALTLTTTPKVRPITLGIFEYLSSTNENWSQVMATAGLASIPAIALLLAAQRFIASGVTGGAVK